MDIIWQNILNGISEPRLAAIIGGGGKSGLLYYLWQGCRKLDWPVVGTTTTKFADKQWAYEEFFFVNDVEDGLKMLTANERQAVLIASRHKTAPPQRVVGPESQWIEEWAMRAPHYCYLIEADGSRGRSLKFHKYEEPVLPRCTAVTIAVMGIDCLQKPVEQRWVHHADLLRSYYGDKHGDEVTVDLIVALLTDDAKGYFHNTPSGSKRVLYLNKVEDIKDHETAEQIADALRTAGSTMTVVSGSVKKQQFKLL